MHIPSPLETVELRGKKMPWRVFVLLLLNKINFIRPARLSNYKISQSILLIMAMRRWGVVNGNHVGPTSSLSVMSFSIRWIHIECYCNYMRACCFFIWFNVAIGIIWLSMAERTARIPVDHFVKQFAETIDLEHRTEWYLGNINYVLCWRAKFQTQMKRCSHDLFQSMLWTDFSTHRLSIHVASFLMGCIVAADVTSFVHYFVHSIVRRVFIVSTMLGAIKIHHFPSSVSRLTFIWM